MVRSVRPDERCLGLACGQVDASRVLKHLRRGVVVKFIVEAVPPKDKRARLNEFVRAAFV